MRNLVWLLAALAAAGCDRLAQAISPAGPDAATVAVAPPPPPPPAPVDPIAAAGLERISFAVDGPLEGAIRDTAAADIAAPLTQVTARLLVWWVDVARDLRKGDTIDLVFQRVPGREPLVHALRFNSGKNAQEYRAYLHKPEGAAFAHYYDPTGVEVEERLQDSPIDEYEQVTSILRDGRRHRGVDWKTPVGTPVKAPFAATITRRNWNFRSNGNCLELRDARGHRIIFLHLAELPRSAAVGKRVKAGEVIAQSGNTGRSTAPHLHYQLETAGGKLLDPFAIHPTYRARLDAAQMTAFDATRASYDAMLSYVPGAIAAAPVAPAPVPALADPALPAAAVPAAAPARPPVAPELAGPAPAQ